MSFPFLLLLGATLAAAQVVPPRPWVPPPAGPGIAVPVNLAPMLLAPMSQGERGMCAPFAAAGLGEFLWKSARREEVRFSPQYLNYSAKTAYTDAPELQVYKTIDGLPGYVAVAALAGGFVPERAWPYEPKPPRGGEGVERFTGRPPRDIGNHLRRDFRFTPVSIERDKIGEFILRERKPVVFNLMWYFDAVDHRTGDVRDPTARERKRCLEKGEGCGGHTVLLVGYDPRTREFVLRNSWGAKWGAGGYGRISEDYVLRDCEVCHHLAGVGSLPEDQQRMVLNATKGWSASLE